MTLQQIGFCAFDLRHELSSLDHPIYKAAPGKPVFDLTDPFDLPPYLERSDDISSCAYFYLRDPDTELPPLPSLSERTAALAPSREAPIGSDIDPEIVAAYFALLKKNRSV